MGERSLASRSDLTRLNWDTSDFPILCELCLGTTPYVRMIKADYDSECKICKRPFTVFSWKPDKTSRYKKTEICPTCAKIKNVCQTCLFDLQFGLPVEVRDKFLKEKVDIPNDAVNRDFFTANNTKNIDKLDLPYDKDNAYPLLEKYSYIKKVNDNDKGNEGPNMPKVIKRNLPHICSFYVKGHCARGDLCPYRHELPQIEDERINSMKSINARYEGVEDPIAKKILSEYSDTKPPKPPLDKSVTTLYISGITDDSIKEKDLVLLFSKFGELKGVKLMLKSYCAFVTFVDRANAEKCIEAMYNKLIINKEKYRLTWAKVTDSEFISSNVRRGKGKGGQGVNSNDNNDDQGDGDDDDDVAYKTECPLYDAKGKTNSFVKTEVIDDKIVNIINLTGYDNNEKPFYASMAKNAKGGQLLMNKRKRALDEL